MLQHATLSFLTNPDEISVKDLSPYNDKFPISSNTRSSYSLSSSISDSRRAFNRSKYFSLSLKIFTVMP